MIKIEGLRKRANGEYILKDINFRLPSGSVLGIIGESGSGKTSLLMCLTALQNFDAGSVTVKDMTVASGSVSNKDEYIWNYRRQIGVVFQHLYLFPHLSVLQNIIEAPVHVLHQPRADAEAKAMELLGKVGLSHKADDYPEDLSGGEQQRVAICRALAMNPEVLLLDEPTSALDPRYSSDVRSLLQEFVSKGHTVIIVSHSLNFLRGFATHLIYMEKGELIEFNTAEKFLDSPGDERTRNFLSHFLQVI
ncbi:MAG: Arginine transport ATP-binding protein ArtM [Ignavibacteriaceae bacterium]|nr:Arginine transport ATP-binding protein ArtM [Ignavibacteriaceae bacterium]